MPRSHKKSPRHTSGPPDAEKLVLTRQLERIIAGRTEELVRANSVLQREKDYFRQVLDEASIGICIVSPEGRFLAVNPALCGMLGYTADTLLGMTFYTITHPDDRSKSTNQVEDAITGRIKQFAFEKRYLRADGETIWASLSGTLIRDPAGIPLYFITYLQDVSEHRRAEESLKESERRLVRAQSIASVGDWEIDLNTRSVWGSSEACRIYGLEPVPSYLSLPVIESCPLPEYRPMLDHARESLIAGTGIYDVEFQIRRINSGEVRWVHSRAELILDDRTMPRKISGVIQDVTERRMIEESLRISEDNYRLLFRNNPIPLWVYDLDTLRFLAVNDAAVNQYGYSEAEFLSMKITEIRPEEDVPRLVGSLDSNNAVIREAGTWRHRRKDGSIIEVQITTHNLEFEGRQARLVLANDVTQQLHAERALRESESQYRGLFEHASDAIIIIEPVNGTIVEANSRAGEIYGHTREELIGMHMPDLSTNRQREREAMEAALSAQSIEGFETIHRHKDGHEIYLQISASVIEYNKSRAILSIHRDVTGEKKLQKELLQSQKMLSIGTLAGGIAHDFNNILNIILGYASMLEAWKQKPEKFSEAITAITNAVDRGTSVVRQILTFARKTNAAFGPVSLDHLVNELYSMLRQTISRTIELRHETDAGLPLITADYSQIYQVLLNLCVNARDAMPGGGTITIRGHRTGSDDVKHRFRNAGPSDYLCVEVSDTGTGMDETTKARIFDPFFTTKEQGKGTGLGLAVVYGIMQTHHGFIDVESAPGCGTTFRLFFPLTAAGSLPQESRAEVRPQSLHGTETILLVEDEKPILDMLTFALESHGYSVLTAENGIEGIAMYRQHLGNIALVVSDMGLPGMAGQDEFFKLREINPGVKVILASGYFVPETRDRLVQAGANGFIQKPFKTVQILTLIREILDQAEPRGH